MKLTRVKNLYILVIFLLLPFISNAQEYEDWEVWAEVMSEWCSCPVTLYESYQDSKNNEVGASYDNGVYTGGNNSQERNPGNSLCPDGTPCYITLHGSYYTPTNTEAGYQNDPQNDPNAPCYSCDCDPLFCIGANPNVPQPKDYDYYGPPQTGPQYDPFYYTWDSN